MQESFTLEQKAEIISSLQRYFTDNFDYELNELQAGFFLDYIFQEIAPFAYNRGVSDAQGYFTARAEDLPGVCFQDVLTYWEKRKGASRAVRRKPGF
ncbi:MAG: DUF2164 domain-containing protein [Bacteroidota bacterium]